MQKKKNLEHTHCSPCRYYCRPPPPLIASANRRRDPSLKKSGMPGIGAMDPANLDAQACAELGFSRRLKQPRRISPYPGLGEGGGYDVWYHKQQLQRFNASEAIAISLASIYRWADRHGPGECRGCRRVRRGGDAAALRSLPSPWRRSGKRRREEGQGEVRGDGNGRGGVQ